jgi:hypothetical protein
MSRINYLLAVPFFIWVAAGFTPVDGTLLGVDLVSTAHAQSQSKVYELRTYTALDGKLEDLKRRFRDHTIKIFDRHDMVSVGYWTPQDGPKNTLIYLLAHPSRDAATRNWDAFRKDPDWIKARDESEANGKIVEKVVSVFMDPTPFSPMK